MTLQVPVAFFVFRRPEVSARVFSAIAAARPQTLLVVGDGPRPGKPGEAELVAETRALIERVDWNCEVLTNFSKDNLGCKRRFVTGLSWVFERTEEAIFLEDDCLPDPTFFGYCQELLKRYRDDRRVAAISGNNFQPGAAGDNSYYFSKYFHCWGWATWRRAWESFDFEMKTWLEFLASGLMFAVADSPREADYWRSIFERQHRKEIDSWAYPWMYSCWAQGGLTIRPNLNLVANLGFGEGASHTSDASSALSDLPTAALPSLRHPRFVVRHKAADMHTFKHVFEQQSSVRPSSAIRRTLRSLQRPLECNVKRLVSVLANWRRAPE